MMRTRYSHASFITLATLGSLGSVLPALATPPIYHVVDLGTLNAPSNLPGSQGFAINASGNATGVSYNATPSQRAFFYDGSMHDVPTLGTSNAIGRGINATNGITGQAPFTGNVQHAFLYNGGSVGDIGVFPGGDSSIGYGINDSGDIVGKSGTSNHGTPQAFHYSGGVLVNMGTLGGVGSSAAAINASGQITGLAGIATTTHAFRTAPGNVIDASADLGTFVGATGYSQGDAINDLGQVTGYSDSASTFGRAFRTTPGGTVGDGTATEIGSLNGTSSFGRGINLAGTVVGQSNSLAFYYDTALFDLNNFLDASSAGWTLFNATGINNNGLIVGTGRNPAGKGTAFILVPAGAVATPEPGTVGLLMGLGVSGGLFAWRRRRRA